MPNYAKLEEAYNRACGLTHTILACEGLHVYSSKGFEDLMEMLASDYTEAKSHLVDLQDNDEDEPGQDEIVRIMGVIRKAAMSVVARFLVGARDRRGDEDTIRRMHLVARNLLRQFMSGEEAHRFISFVELFVTGPLRDGSDFGHWKPMVPWKSMQATVMEIYESFMRDRIGLILTPEERLAIANAGNDE